MSDFLANLPPGVTYNEPGQDAPEDNSSHRNQSQNFAADMDSDGEERDIITCGDFTINIEKISK